MRIGSVSNPGWPRGRPMSRAALTDYVAALMWQGQKPCNWFWSGTVQEITG